MDVDQILYVSALFIGTAESQRIRVEDCPHSLGDTDPAEHTSAVDQFVGTSHHVTAN